MRRRPVGSLARAAQAALACVLLSTPSAARAQEPCADPRRCLDLGDGAAGRALRVHSDCLDPAQRQHVAKSFLARMGAAIVGVGELPEGCAISMAGGVATLAPRAPSGRKAVVFEALLAGRYVSARSAALIDPTFKVAVAALIDPTFKVAAGALIDPTFRTGAGSLIDPTFKAGATSLIDPTFKAGAQSLIDPTFRAALRALADSSFQAHLESLIDPTFRVGLQTLIDPTFRAGMRSLIDPTFLVGQQLVIINPDSMHPGGAPGASPAPHP